MYSWLCSTAIFVNLIMITCAHTSHRGRNDGVDVCLTTLRLINYVYQERNKSLKNRLETLEKHIGCLQMEGTSHLKARLAGVSDTLCFSHRNINLPAPTEAFLVLKPQPNIYLIESEFAK